MSCVLARPVSELRSPSNPLIRDVRRAVTRSAATKKGLWVAESLRLFDEALASRLKVDTVVAAARRRREVEARLRGHDDVTLSIVDDNLFAQITSTETSQGVLALVEPPQCDLDELFKGAPLVVALDAIQDPGNVGTIVRTAEAFGATGVVLLKGTARAANPKTLRASAGSLFRLPHIEGLEPEELIDEIDKRGLCCFAASPRAERPLSQARLERGCVIVLGSEAHGVRPALRDAAEGLRIPTRAVESLNVSAAAAVVLYEASRRRSASAESRNDRGMR